MGIHLTAIISDSASVSPEAVIGPYVVIGPDVVIKRGAVIDAHAHIAQYTEIDEDVHVYTGAVLGTVPQDLAFTNDKTFLKIGKRCVIREYVTVNRGTKPGTATVIGDDCYFMATAHAGHNCRIGNNVIIANGTLLAGYVTIEDGVFVSGNVVVHQFCRIGKLAMIGGFTGVNKDVPPFLCVRGPSVVWSINLVGLRRARIARADITQIKEAYTLMYRSGLNTDQALEKIEAMGPCPDVAHFMSFIKASKRGICKYRFEGEDKEFFEKGGEHGKG